VKRSAPVTPLSTPAPSSSVPAFAAPRFGIYRRRILVRGEPGCTRADLEDDPHRHGVEIHHDGRRVTAVRGHALRVPWSACPGATGVLDRLIGMELSDDPLAVYAHTGSREQCTHLFDVAGLAVAHAARGTVRRQYDAQVPILTAQGARTATLFRDGERVLEWELAWSLPGSTLTGPARWAGQSIRRVLDRARELCTDLDELEAVAILRRAVHISGCRLANLDLHDTPAAFAASLRGACHVFGRSGPLPATRVRGSTRDFTHNPDDMLADLRPLAAAREEEHP
jgi:hypothetical protein